MEDCGCVSLGAWMSLALGCTFLALFVAGLLHHAASRRRLQRAGGEHPSPPAA